MTVVASVTRRTRGNGGRGADKAAVHGVYSLLDPDSVAMDGKVLVLEKY